MDRKIYTPGEIVVWDYSLQGGSSQEDNCFGTGKKGPTIFNSIKSFNLYYEHSIFVNRKRISMTCRQQNILLAPNTAHSVIPDSVYTFDLIILKR